MTRPTSIAAFLALGCLALAVSGCPGDVEYTRVFPAQCQSEPVFLLLSPNPDGRTVVTDDNLFLQFDVGVFELVDKLGAPPEPCEGHFHVRIDGGEVTMVTTDEQNFDVHALEAGQHTVQITVHNNDHSRIDEIDALSATFTVSR